MPTLTARLADREVPLTTQTSGVAGCSASNAGPLRLKAGAARVVLSASAPVFLDYLELEPWKASHN
jgi:hypothetical protein